MTYFTDFQNAVNNITANAPASATTIPITVVDKHPGSAQPVTLTVHALVNPGPNQGHFGVTASYDGASWQRPPLWQAPGQALSLMGQVIVTIVQLPGNIIRGHIALNQAVVGPVGIVTATGEAAATVPVIGPAYLLAFTALISMSLAITNALPIPALDGGRVVFVLIEMLRRGKRISPEREGLVNLIGMGLLLLLILVVTINDVGNIIH